MCVHIPCSKLMQFREIIDESDVFVDVHKAIRRMAPAPRTRYTKGSVVVDAPGQEGGEDEQTDVPDEETSLLGNKDAGASGSRKPPLATRETTLLMRRRSSAGSSKAPGKPVPIRSNTADLRQHLRHLGPSNVASRPKATKYTSVKIKPGVGTIPEGGVPRPASIMENESNLPGTPHSQANGTSTGAEGGAENGILDAAGKTVKDGTLAVAQNYGAISGSARPDDDMAEDDTTRNMSAREASELANKHTSPNLNASTENDKADESQDAPELPQKLIVEGSTSRPISSEGRRSSSSHSHSTLGEMESHPEPKPHRRARSGSITENVVHVGGHKKVVLETNSSSDTEEGKNTPPQLDGADDDRDEDNAGDEAKDGSKKKKKKKRGGKKFRNKDKSANGSGESTPLLKQDD